MKLGETSAVSGVSEFAAALAIALWAGWTLVTWFLEGRIETFNRPDAVADRLIYTFVANILVGVVGAMLLLRGILGPAGTSWKAAGFGSWGRTAVWGPLGFSLGLAVFLVQGAPSMNPVVILNAFAQVFVVSTAEVLVCWSVVAGVLALVINGSRWLAFPVAGIIASILFGVYHFAHSAPFNTVSMVAFLSGIGLLTSVFFFLSQDVYGTIIFHNFMGVLGVLQALLVQGKLASFETLQTPLLVTTLMAAVILVALDLLLCRSRLRHA